MTGLIERVEEDGGPIDVLVDNAIPTDRLDRVDEYRPTKDASARGYRRGLIVDVPRERVADEVVAAVARDRMHVRLPRRAVGFPLLAQLPREVTRAVLTGIPHRDEPDDAGPAADDQQV